MATNSQFPRVETDETTRNVVQLQGKKNNTLKGVKVHRQDFLSDGDSSDIESVSSQELVPIKKKQSTKQQSFTPDPRYGQNPSYANFGGKGSFEAFANPKVPTTVFDAPEGGVGTDGDISRFVDLLTMQAAKGLAVDPSIARKSNE